MSVLPTSVAAPIVKVRVVVTAHAVKRYVERVQPCADFTLAVSQIARLFSLGVVAPGPAEWDVTQRPAPLYLTVGDVSFVLDVDACDRERLVALTCVTRGSRRSSPRRRRGRPHSSPQRGSYGRHACASYRRPAPGQLRFQADDLEQF